MFAVFGICLVKARAKAEKTVKGQDGLFVVAVKRQEKNLPAAVGAFGYEVTP